MDGMQTDRQKDKKDGLNGEESNVRGDLTELELHRGTHQGDSYVRIVRSGSNMLRRVSPGYLRASELVSRPHGMLSQVYVRLKAVLVGKPLPTEQEIVQRLDKVRALAVFGSDPISSCAYATEPAHMRQAEIRAAASLFI